MTINTILLYIRDNKISITCRIEILLLFNAETDNLLSGRKGIHALFIDFRKASDLVDHGILLEKLARIHVSKCFWLWTQSFLEGRITK